MGWWNAGNNVLGDRPADLLWTALDGVARARAAAGRPLPSLAEALGGLGAVLRGADADTVSGGDAGRLRTVPPPEGGAPVAEAEPGADLREAMADALGGVARAYRDTQSRPPTHAEVLAMFAFVLRPTPRPWAGEGAEAPVASVEAA